MRKSWHWPVGIIIAYSGFVLFLLAAWIIFKSQPVDLVAENYYEKQIKYQEQIDRIQRTKNLSEAVKVKYNAESQQIAIRFPKIFPSAQVEGKITLYRPSDAKMDFSLPIALNDLGIQIIPANTFTPGLWRIKLSWAVNEVEYYYEEPLYF